MEHNQDDLIRAEAAAWHARLRSADCDAGLRKACEAWCAADPRQAQAFRRLAALESLLVSASGQDARFRSLAAEALVAPSTPARRGGDGSRWQLAAGLCAAAVAAALFAAYGLRSGSFLAGSDVYANTGLAEQSITLADGTVMHLDVGAEADVRLGRARREIHLSAGRAYFEVAHDRSRPFVVAAQGTETTALGTRFSVELYPGKVAVTLEEGSVRVQPAGSQSAWQEVLSPGEQLRIDVRQPRPERVAINAARVTSWSRGRLEFDGVPLGTALEALNRYSKVKVHLGDPSLADFPLGGSFEAGGDAEALVEALAMLLPLRSVRSDGGEIVLFREHGNASR
jgi:transmembrane sensor